MRSLFRDCLTLFQYGTQIRRLCTITMILKDYLLDDCLNPLKAFVMPKLSSANPDTPTIPVA